MSREEREREVLRPDQIELCTPRVLIMHPVHIRGDLPHPGTYQAPLPLPNAFLISLIYLLCP